MVGLGKNSDDPVGYCVRLDRPKVAFGHVANLPSVLVHVQVSTYI